MAKIDWNSIETDFLATGLSYARLAEKHGVSLNSLKKKAAAGHWQARLRELTVREESNAESDEAETVEPEELALEIRRSRRVRLQDTADRMLDKIVRTLDAMDTDEPYALAALVRALRDLLNSLPLEDV